MNNTNYQNLFHEAKTVLMGIFLAYFKRSKIIIQIYILGN